MIPNKSEEAAMLKISEYLEIDFYEAYDAFLDAGFPNESQSKRIKQAKQDIRTLKAVKGHLEEAAAMMAKLKKYKASIIARGLGGLTVSQLENFAEVIGAYAENDHSDFYDLRGGTRWDARKAACAVAEIFLNNNWKISFAQDHLGNPSSRFGKAVEFSLDALEIDANWSKPTKYAYDLITKT